MTQQPPQGHRAGLHQRLFGDVAAATIAATLVTPAVAIIDRAVVEKVASHQPFMRTLWTHTKTAARQPGRFVFSRPFGILWTLYAATFTAANGVDTFVRDWRPSVVGTATFLATVAVNVPLGVWKDLRFARIYGGTEANKAATASKLPIHAPEVKSSVSQVRAGGPSRATAAVFLFRDSLTLFGSFVLPPAVTRIIPEGAVGSAHATALAVQLLVPASTQLVVTPVHLVGLDMYNRPEKGLGLANRITHTQSHFGSATALRCLRVLPAFGFGVMANRDLRNKFHTAV